MFIVGLIPSVLTIPLRWFMPESPRWLASKGRLAEADAVVKLLEDSATRRGAILREPVVRPVDPKATTRSDWRELFQGIYLKRTFTIWGLWVCVYMINNGLVTWLPTLYKQVFHLPLQTSLAYGWITSGVGVVALDHLRPADRQSRPQALVRDRVPARHGAAADAVVARRDLGDRSADPRRPPPTRFCRPSRSRSISIRPNSIRRVCARSAPASAVRGSGRDRRSVRCWSAPSWRTSASATSSRPSRRSRWSAGW